MTEAVPDSVDYAIDKRNGVRSKRLTKANVESEGPRRTRSRKNTTVIGATKSVATARKRSAGNRSQKQPLPTTINLSGTFKKTKPSTGKLIDVRTHHTDTSNTLVNPISNRCGPYLDLNPIKNSHPVKRESDSNILTTNGLKFQKSSSSDSFAGNVLFCITEIANRNGITSLDSQVTLLCNIGLKHLMKRIISQLIASKSDFLSPNKRALRSEQDTLIFNRSLQASISLIKLHQSLNSLPCDYYIPIRKTFQPKHLTSQTLNDDSMKPNFMVMEKRSITNSGSMPGSNAKPVVKYNLLSPERTTITRNSVCSLRHLYNVLYTNRSLIPVSVVYHNALNRTLIAFSNAQYISQARKMNKIEQTQE